MASALQRKDENLIPFLPQIDFDMSLWMAYQNCINAPLFGRFSNSFRDCVVIFQMLIESMPNYIDDEYNKQAHGEAIEYFRSLVNLMQRKHFFDKPTKDLGHL